MVIVLMFSVWRVALAGGNFNNGTNAGLLNSNFNNSSGNVNTNIGAHLYLKSEKNSTYDAMTVPLGKKNKIENSISISYLMQRTSCLLQANNEMKRHANIYGQIASRQNIELAFKNAKKGKRHYQEVANIISNPQKYLSNLQTMLEKDAFVNSEYQISDRYTGHKWRKIYKLPFYPDRLVHHCIVQVMQPIWINMFIRNTFATIPGRGIHDGVTRVKKALNDVQNTQYCLKLDVRKYYPSVDHNVLKCILQKQVKDKRLINLFNTIIDSAPGIPIGNYISQWFGNVYIAYLDHFIKEKLQVKYYFRYADDMVLLSDSKTELWTWKAEIEQYLNNNLKLSLKDNYQVFPIDVRGIDFLGYRFYHTHTLIRKEIVKNFKKSINSEKAAKQTQSAYWGWFKHADTYNLTQKYFQS